MKDSDSDSYYHRHDKAAEEALKVLQTLAAQAIESNTSIVASLEKFGWILNGTSTLNSKGIRMFVLPSEGDDLIGGTRRGVRTNENLFLRGEGIIEGQWKLSDVIGTIRSMGARKIWDARFDGVDSSEVACLSSEHRLLHLKIRGTPPISDTDITTISTSSIDQDGKTGYILSTSVNDHLIPDSGFRTTINLQGFCLRSVDSPPDFETPLPPIRPSHKRNQSSKNSISGLIPQTLSAQTSGSNSFVLPVTGPNGSDSLAVPTTTPTFAPPPIKLESTKRPGIHVSLIVHASPSINLPASYSAELATRIPLSIAALSRYLSSSGFAPYILRRQPRTEMDVLEEDFNADAMKYRVVFRIHAGIKNEDTLIRFCGLSFGNGRFIVEVSRVRDFRIEYDVEPEVEPEISWKETGGTNEGDSFARSASRRTTLTVSNSTTATRLDYFHKTSPTSTPSNSLPSTPLATYEDIANSTGPTGGCTLVIPNSTIANGPPITVTIVRNSIKTVAPMDTMKQTSRALGKASRSVLEDRQNESIEQMLRSSTAEGRAEMDLKGTREVLKILRKARIDEAKMLEEKEIL